jgi:quercetin dioxygenase-like cupin family protein
MQILRAGARASRDIADWGSHGVTMTATARVTSSEFAHVTIGHYSAGSVLGRHPTGSWQTFAVVTGRGWAEGADGARVDLEAGDVVIWEPGEHHASGSDDGMTVCIVQTAAKPDTARG